MTHFCQLCQRERDRVFVSGGVQACHLHFTESEWDEMLGDEGEAVRSSLRGVGMIALEETIANILKNYGVPGAERISATLLIHLRTEFAPLWAPIKQDEYHDATGSYINDKYRAKLDVMNVDSILEERAGKLGLS
jgi:hypothetical protein